MRLRIKVDSSKESRLVLKNTQTIPIGAETELVMAARQDPGKFGELYQLYVQRIYRYLYSRAGNTQEAEDLTAQTFLAALENLESFRQDGCFPAWLFGIARNKVVDHYRRARKNIGLDEQAEDSPVTEPLAGIIHSERAEALSALVRELPEGERELLRLRYLAEMSYRDIARALKKNEDAVKKSLYRLLERLQRQLEVSND
jgi:RNA polymerase sigma-70 factor (ECF subfamily)